MLWPTLVLEAGEGTDAYVFNMQMSGGKIEILIRIRKAFKELSFNKKYYIEVSREEMRGYGLFLNSSENIHV